MLARSKGSDQVRIEADDREDVAAYTLKSGHNVRWSTISGVDITPDLAV